MNDQIARCPATPSAGAVCGAVMLWFYWAQGVPLMQCEHPTGVCPLQPSVCDCLSLNLCLAALLDVDSWRKMKRHSAETDPGLLLADSLLFLLVFSTLL
jgi:hypothetical protein